MLVRFDGMSTNCEPLGFFLGDGGGGGFRGEWGGRLKFGGANRVHKGCISDVRESQA